MLEKLKKAVAPKPKAKNWVHRTEDLPWTDHPDALKMLDEKVGKGEIAEADAPLVRQFIEDGFCVLKGAVPGDVIDEYNAEIEALWMTDTPQPNVTFLDVYVEEGEMTPPVHELPQPELLKMPLEKRKEVLGRGKWRIHGFHFHSEPAKKIYDNQRSAKMVSTLLGVPTDPTYSISFHYGSRHYLHQDMMVFHLYPKNYLIGGWMAMEDIDPESGPVIYQPGSHKEPVFEEYANYPQTCLRTSDPELRARYDAHLAEISQKYETKKFIAEKGDILLWHAMLLHGGDTVIDETKTRRSFVVHYIPEGYNKADEVVGPFMW